MVLLKFLSKFWRTLRMPLITCEIDLILTWSSNSIILAGTAVNQLPIFLITNTKLYVPVVTLSVQNNAKLFEELKPGFKRTINLKKYQSKVTTDYLIDPSFQGLNRLFVLSFEDNAH